MADKPMFVADGHHRYETACNYRAQLVERAGSACRGSSSQLRDDDAGRDERSRNDRFANPSIASRNATIFVRPRSSSVLGGAFECKVVPADWMRRDAVWSEMESADEQGLIGLYAAEDDPWVLCQSDRRCAGER